MSRYVWTPFETVSTGALQLANNGRIQGIDDLGKLRDGDVLFISAHYAAYQPRIGGTTEEERLTPAELCYRLFDAGLRRRFLHYTIKLWICQGAVGMKTKQGFAYEFWRVMTQTFLFKRLTVYSYTAATCDPIWDSHKTCYRVTEDGQIGEQLPGTAKDYRFGLDPRGRLLVPAPFRRRALTGAPPVAGS
jgi:hypothetical protein